MVIVCLSTGYVLSNIHFLLSVRWWKQPISVLQISPPITVQSDVSCSDTLKMLGSEAIDQMPVVDKNGYISHSLFDNSIIYTHIINVIYCTYSLYLLLVM